MSLTYLEHTADANAVANVLRRDGATDDLCGG